MRLEIVKSIQELRCLKSASALGIEFLRSLRRMNLGIFARYAPRTGTGLPTATDYSML